MKTALKHYSIKVTAISLLFITNSLFAQTVKENFWIPNGPVYAIAPSSDSSSIYIGGSFSQVGPAVGGGVLIDTATGIYDADFPKVTGQVNTTIPDGSGGWFIGGLFTHIDNVAINNLAHIKSDKTLDTNWNPDVNGLVSTIAISGTTLYIGGDFVFVGGLYRWGIAAIDIPTGSVTGWNPLNQFASIKTIAILGSTVFVGGDFERIGGSDRFNLAAIDTATGNVTSWDPNANQLVNTLTILDTTIYVGGEFTQIGDSARNCIAAISVSTGKATNWNPNIFDFLGMTTVNPNVKTFKVVGDTMYVGGLFSNIGDSARYSIGALEISTGEAISWNPNTSSIANLPTINALAISGNIVYAGGWFTSIGDSARNHIAAVNIINGEVAAWNPNAGGIIYALEVSENKVFTGGLFSCINGQTRNNIAAIKVSDGKLSSWNPNANNQVLSLLVSGTTIYASGSFTNIGDSIRNHIVAIDATTGIAINWNPNIGGTFVKTLTSIGTTI